MHLMSHGDRNSTASAFFQSLGINTYTNFRKTGLRAWSDRKSRKGPRSSIFILHKRSTSVVLIDKRGPYLSNMKKRLRARSLLACAFLIYKHGPYWLVRSAQARRQVFRKLVYVLMSRRGKRKVPLNFCLKWEANFNLKSTCQINWAANFCLWEASFVAS